MQQFVQNWLVRVRVHIADAVRYSRSVSELSAIALVWRYLVRRRADPSVKLPLLMAALRRASDPLLRRLVHELLAPWLRPPQSDIWRTQRIGWSRYRDEMADPVMRKSLILKAPSAGEKGVLYISFEVNLLRLCEHFDIARVLADYYIVVATSWSPPDCQPLLCTANLSSDPLFVQISNLADVDMLRMCGPSVRAVPILACDWIDPRCYAPKPHPARQLDILMVAGWARFKGHWMLFRALKRMRKGLRVLLIGQDMEGRTADDVYTEAKAFGVADRIQMIRDVPPRRVTELQCESRITVGLSKREGSGVVTAESLFADTPVAMLRGAHVGSRAHINDRTGILTEPRRLHHDLSVLVEQSATYTPRAWALEHITCFHSHRRLNDILRDHTVNARGNWSRDIVPFCWRPDPVYIRDGDKADLAPAYDDLRARHGIVFGGPLQHSRPGAIQSQ